MINSLLLEKAQYSILEFLEEFQANLLMEVKKTMQQEISSKQTQDVSADEILTRKEAAALLNCSLTTLCHYQKEGIIPFYKAGKKVIFKKQEILDAIRRQVKKGGRHEK